MGDAPDVAALLDAAGVRVTTMGRGPDEDPLFFPAAAAAGRWRPPRWRSGWLKHTR